MGVLAVEEQLHARYGERTARSRALYERALGTLPGGDTRTGTFFLPYPIFTERGQDCRLFDVDGNEYLDFLNNFTSLVHGHAHPNITAAIAEQAAKGTVYATPVEIQLAHAEELSRRVPSMERIRFANSGTEAVMNVIRAARAFTGRQKLLKMEGGYHGTYDPVEVSVSPGPYGPPWPTGKSDEPGLSAAPTSDVLVAPFNDLDRTVALVRPVSGSARGGDCRARHGFRGDDLRRGGFLTWSPRGNTRTWGPSDR